MQSPDNGAVGGFYVPVEQLASAAQPQTPGELIPSTSEPIPSLYFGGYHPQPTQPSGFPPSHHSVSSFSLSPETESPISYRPRNKSLSASSQGISTLNGPRPALPPKSYHQEAIISSSRTNPPVPPKLLDQSSPAALYAQGRRHIPAHSPAEGQRRAQHTHVPSLMDRSRTYAAQSPRPATSIGYVGRASTFSATLPFAQPSPQLNQPPRPVMPTILPAAHIPQSSTTVTPTATENLQLVMQQNAASASTIPESPLYSLAGPEQPVEEEDDELAMVLRLSLADAVIPNSATDDDDEDEELRRALEESARTYVDETKMFTSSPSARETTLPTLASDDNNSLLRSGPSHGDTLQVNIPGWITPSDRESREKQARDDEAFARALAEQMRAEDAEAIQRAQSLGSPQLSSQINRLSNISSNGLSGLSGPSVSGSTSLYSNAISATIQRPVSQETAQSSLYRSDSETSHHSETISAVSSPIPSNSLSIPSCSGLHQSKSTSDLSVLADLDDARSDIVKSGPNSFIDAELLRGVSIGFTAPSISAAIGQTEPMPNIITLPFGRSPPLHLQAPNWRQLRRLLASCGSTRIEPTLEALEANKTVLRLRTVIQFIRLHINSTEWRTVLYFTIDHPVLPRTPNALKYTNNDTTALPFSYTLSPVIPALLRDGADNQLSTFYTVPNLPTLPYPNLPITFPVLADYLQSALIESRKAINDSSSNVKRLARCVDQYYPQDRPSAADNDERRGIFSRVLGRGKKKTGPSANEDSYDLVTPFVMDQW